MPARSDIISRFIVESRLSEPRATVTASTLRELANWWQLGTGRLFDPAQVNETDLRLFFVENPVGPTTYRRKSEAITQFFNWVQRSGVRPDNPAADLAKKKRVLIRDSESLKVAKKAQSPEREVSDLKALNAIAEALNRSTELERALNDSLVAVTEHLGLNTGWIFLLDDGPAAARGQPHDFPLAAERELPPGLRDRDRYFLRCPPDCQCQELFRLGHLTRAANIVECTRLGDASDANQETGGLQFHASVPLISRGRRLGILNVATPDWQLFRPTDLQLLSTVGQQMAAAVERAQIHQQVVQVNRRYEKELTLAHNVQASLLPRQFPSPPGFSFAAEWQAAQEMAGDFYDVIRLPDGKIGLVIADVSGKGAPAALFMAMVWTMIRNAIRVQPDPASALKLVNRDLCAQPTSDMFVSVFYGALDPVARTFQYATAGHNPPLHRRADGRVEPLPGQGVVLAVNEHTAVGEGTLRLKPGEMLLLYTDGATEAVNVDGEEFGTARVSERVARARSAKELVASVKSAVIDFASPLPIADDITLLALHHEEPRPAPALPDRDWRTVT